MDIFDTHTHIEDDKFSGKIPQVMESADDAGVKRMICVGTSLDTSRECIQLATAYPDTISASVGIHPTRCNEHDPADLTTLRNLSQNKSVVAIGETGLDFHHDFSPRQTQERFFRAHISLAIDSQRPIIIHARKADPETLQLLREYDGTLRGIRHCFDTSKQIAQDYVELGFHVAFGAILTRPGHKKVKHAARWMPDERLLLETDCPYMKPQSVDAPFNEPRYITHTLRALAQLREQSVEEIARITWDNAHGLFFSDK